MERREDWGRKRIKRRKRRKEKGERQGERRGQKEGEILDVLQKGARRELEDKRSYLEHTPNTGFFFFKEKPKLNTVELTVC